MEMPTSENLQHPIISSNDVDHQQDNLVYDILNHREAESKHEFAEEEVRSMLELIASSGKFWLDWEKLKSLLSFRLKQVWGEYPEAKMSSDDQNSALGETFQDLVKRLDEALCSFIEGPPFTLQRLCEILLTAKSIYPNLSKLALALEKNLLVTSTLSISTDPYPPTVALVPDEPEKVTKETELKGSEEAELKRSEVVVVNASEEAELKKSEDVVVNASEELPQMHGSEEAPQVASNSEVPNGVEPVDEIMAEADTGDDMTIDMEALEGIAEPASAPQPTNS